MAFLLISLFLLLPYAALIVYYRNGWIQDKIYQTKTGMLSKTTPFISVIIAARNEEKNIGNCIESIINQTYPAHLFEVIIVDDNSTDSTPAIVNSFEQNNIRVFKLNDFTENEKLNSYKKKAVETAISVAKGNLIVTTDADCIVQSEWLQTIASCYEESSAV